MPSPQGMRPTGGGRGSKQMLQKGAVKSLDKGVIKRLFSYMKPYRARLAFVVVCIILSTIASVMSSLFIQSLIDDYIAPLLLVANPDFSALLVMILKMCIIFAIGIVSSFVYARIMAVVSQGTLKDVRDEMFNHLQTLPIRYFDTHKKGDIMSHFTNDADALRQMLSQTLPSLISSVLSMVMVLGSMIHLSIWLTILVIVFTACSFVAVKGIAGKSGKYFVKQQASLAQMNGYIEEMINGQKVIKVFCHEEKAKEAFDEKNVILEKNMGKANALAMMVMPFMGNLGNIIYVLVALVGGALGIAGVSNLSVGGEATITLGTIASFLVLSRNFMNPITQVSQQLNSVVMAMAGAGRIFELLDQMPEEDKGDCTLVNAKYVDGVLTECEDRTGKWAWKRVDHIGHQGELIKGDLTELKGDIILDMVDFGYEPDQRVLTDISIHAEPGQKVALVGATGAGKTTITNLINRFYDIADGKIRYDGININHIVKKDLRQSLGVVLQDVYLFTGTVMENIRYGRLDATDEECIAAAKLANADGFIRMLPNGYHTVLEGDGSGLSQGQRQLLSIARCAVADPPVMILDEATSSIDTHTEQIVQNGMDNLMKGRTVFVIAHRLSTIQNSDKIMVMDKGQIIESGNHDELMAKKGRYYQLYMGSFDEEE